MPSKYIVLLEPGVWLTPYQDDPCGRTLFEASARRYARRSAAVRALTRARWYRPFPDAQILEVPHV